jgi:phospholipid transport system transporter-binding protein
VSEAAAGEVLVLEAAELSFQTIPAVLARTAAYSARKDLPDKLTIDFSAVTGVDSSAVAMLLEWRRMSAARGSTLVFVNLPANLMALAELYGVADLIQPHQA